ncbi:MAG: hypothetical protein QMD88_06350 [Coprothermobacterota bacterium]|nr:hypothetical protein [Coprothermobacterota bacterium]
MKKLIFLLAGILVLALTLIGCGGPAPSSPQTPSSSPSASPSPTPTQTGPSPSASSPSPTSSPPVQGETDFPPYPGATQVSKVQTTDSGPSGQQGTVTIYFLTTNDPFEKVRDYYKNLIPSGWKTVSSSESTNEEGLRTFYITGQSPSEDKWATFVVGEYEENVTSINHQIGIKGEAPSTGGPGTGEFNPYPNAEVLDSGEWSGVGPNGQEAKWSMVRLSTEDSYDKVKTYYALNIPSTFLKVFDHEETDEDGAKSYTMMLQSLDQGKFYAIFIQENLDEGTVEITHNYGTK